MSLTDNPVQSSHENHSIAIDAATLGRLATRVRAGGMFLCSIDQAAKVSSFDTSADAFYLKYVLPQIQSPGFPLVTTQLKLIDCVPGVVIAVFPVIDRKQTVSTFLIAARSPDFGISEDLLRKCSQLSLDATWLAQRASSLPANDVGQITWHTQMIADALRDQMRVSEMRTEMDSLSNQLSNTYEELSLIYQVSSGMKVTRRPNDFFRQCCLDVMSVLGVRGVGVVLRSESLKQIEPAIYGEVELPAGKIERLADDLMVELRARKSAILSNNLAADKRFGWMGEFARQMVAVPLMRDEQVLGCLFALDVENKPDGFDTVELKLLTSIANESSIYLENAMLFEDVRGLMMGLLRSLTSAVDAKDAYTCGHSERVALLSRYIAQQAGLSEAAVERIYMAGLLHDVGKIGVPEAVLQKAGRLDPAEFEQIKKHPEMGARILRDVKQIQDIIPGVLHHHERYDGKGYPLGLAGENISLMGRIICLADCFDAMTSSRTYRKALPLDVVLTEIRRCAGSQFDPVITDAFLKIAPEKLMDLLKDHRQQMMRYSEASQLRVA